MSAQLPLLPIISIDSGEAQNLDISIALKKIYYQPIDEVKDWLERQAVHQIHKLYPRYIPCASFTSITTHNEVHQADILYMPYDKRTWCENSEGQSKPTMGIVERYNRTLREKCGLSQDTSDLLLPITERSQVWMKNLLLVIEDINNSLTRQISMTPAVAIGKEIVIAMPSKLRDGPMGYDEKQLDYNILPILYWILNNKGIGPERSFVREELMVIPSNTELPPRWVLSN
ncbi:hypothetical protein RclHR1_09310011 [Rhizophagus clarus]|uniref:Integrase catalytic domain-containing protein n=1 Tax=Rhizophagus clarus TaxID=94130 RepID=A0A2Z6S4C8_9GLOM|nr:hypothetical protein RclHR1_09310011 [Rhizophagus clarus]